MLLFGLLFIHYWAIHLLPSVKASENGLTFVPINAPLQVNGKASYKKALLKYSARTSLAQARTPEAKKWLNAAIITGDLDHLSPVYFESQGKQVFDLSFDTASAETWVVSSQTPRGARGSKAAYISHKAEHLAGHRWSIPKHDDEFANGIVFLDTVRLGSLLVIDQAIGAAEYISHEFAESMIAGSLGLALSTMSRIRPNPQLTPNANLLVSGITRGVFAIDLKYGTRQVPESCGRYEFGGRFDQHGFFAFAPINMSSGYWQFESSTFRIGDGPILKRFSGLPVGLSIADVAATFEALTANTNNTFNLSTSHQVLIDTATPLILVDDITLFAIYATIAGAAYHHEEQAFVLPCARALNSPAAIYFEVSSHYFSVPYKFGGLLHAELTPELCYGAIQSRGTMEVDVWGSAFLRWNYVVFDEPGERIGVASKS